MLKNNQDNDFHDNKLTNIDSITFNRNPTSENEVTKNVDDSVEEGTILRLNQTLENYLKVSVKIDTYKLIKSNKIQLTEITINKEGNGQYLLPRWKIVFNDKNNNFVPTSFVKATRTNSSTSESGATIVPPIVDSFSYIETSSKNHDDEKMIVSWERTDIIQIINITFHYKRYSILTNDSLKLRSRFRIQLLREDKTCSTQYTIPKNEEYSDTSTEWKILNLDFTIENYGITLIYD